jgi:RimJ/RimL family protein N-acetyltransferase
VEFSDLRQSWRETCVDEASYDESHPELAAGLAAHMVTLLRSTAVPTSRPPAPSWRANLPVISAPNVMIRELRTSDADSLAALLTTVDVSRLMSPPPTTLDGFERFITWTQRERSQGSGVCFGIVPRGEVSAVGVIQVRANGTEWDVAEWGFALGSQYWGTGVFMAAAKLTLAFTFGALRVARLEARAAVGNGRGIGALKKLGAVEEGVLRRSLRLRDECVDQVLWTLSDATAARFSAIPWERRSFDAARLAAES